MINLTDQELLLRLKNTEDSFVERKTVNDLGDCLKTVVAFANSTPVGYPAVLFVGVRDNGEPEGSLSDLDRIQRRLSDKIAEAYPAIYTMTRILRENEKQFLAVIVPGSERRPHFAGQAYTREGSKSVLASEEQFARLIADRNQKTYEILKWKGKGITLSQAPGQYMVAGTTGWHPGKSLLTTVSDCTLHYVTLASVTNVDDLVSYPLSKIELSYDHRRNRLEIRLLEGSLPQWTQVI